jgi:hypothetical protein
MASGGRQAGWPLDPASHDQHRKSQRGTKERPRETIELLQYYLDEQKARRGWRRAKNDGERPVVIP